MHPEAATQSPLVICGAGWQIQGERDEQEDFFLIVPSDTPKAASHILAVLADGMGAHSDGSAASREVASSYVSSYVRRAGGDLVQALQDADASLADSKRSGIIQEDAGATLIALRLDEGMCSWVSVGDSLLYLFRNGQLTSLNEKHTWANRLRRRVERGLMSQEEADAVPDQQALYSAVCGDGIEAVDSRPDAFEYKAGDRFIVASDGLATIVPELESLLGSPRLAKLPAEQACRELLRLVEEKHKPRQDNTTLIVVDVLNRREIFDASTPEHGLEACSVSLLGDRETQQDSCGVWSSPRALMAVVADGAGGHAGGAQASATAVAVMKELWERQLACGFSVGEAAACISEGMLLAHERIISAGGGNSALCGKCAIVVLYVAGNEYAVVHAGDCRLYQGTEAGWERRTEDDSVLQMLINAGRVAPEDIPGHPDQGVLTQALGGSNEPSPHTSHGSFAPGDSFLLCCDGFWNQLPDRLWSARAWGRATRDREQILHSFVADAVRAAKGDSDNSTAIWVYPPEPHRMVPAGASSGCGMKMLGLAAALLLLAAGGVAAYFQFRPALPFFGTVSAPGTSVGTDSEGSHAGTLPTTPGQVAAPHPTPLPTEPVPVEPTPGTPEPEDEAPAPTPRPPAPPPVEPTPGTPEPEDEAPAPTPRPPAPPPVEPTPGTPEPEDEAPAPTPRPPAPPPVEPTPGTPEPEDEAPAPFIPGPGDEGLTNMPDTGAQNGGGNSEHNGAEQTRGGDSTRSGEADSSEKNAQGRSPMGNPAVRRRGNTKAGTSEKALAPTNAQSEGGKTEAPMPDSGRAPSATPLPSANLVAPSPANLHP